MFWKIMRQYKKEPPTTKISMTNNLTHTHTPWGAAIYKPMIEDDKNVHKTE